MNVIKLPNVWDAVGRRHDEVWENGGEAGLQEWLGIGIHEEQPTTCFGRGRGIRRGELKNLLKKKSMIAATTYKKKKKLTNLVFVCR